METSGIFRYGSKKTLIGVLAILVLHVSVASGRVITGPATLPSNDVTYYVTGVGFTATVDSVLTSFTFQNQDLADTIDLVDASGNVLESVDTAAGNTSEIVPVNWGLTAGAQYYLLQTTLDNGVFASWGLAAPSDSEIALTDTGDFGTANSQSLNPANFAFGGSSANSVEGRLEWADFTNITTTAAGPVVPEPASFLLALPAGLAMLLARRRKA